MVLQLSTDEYKETTHLGAFEPVKFTVDGGNHVFTAEFPAQYYIERVSWVLLGSESHAEQAYWLMKLWDEILSSSDKAVLERRFRDQEDVLVSAHQLFTIEFEILKAWGLENEDWNLIEAQEPDKEEPTNREQRRTTAKRPAAKLARRTVR